MMRLAGYAMGLALVLGSMGSLYAQERMTVEQAVELALKQNLRLLSVEKRAGATHDVALSQGARLLPSVHLSEEYQHWDCPAAFSLADFAGGAKCESDILNAPPTAGPNLAAFTPEQRMQLGALFGSGPVIARKQDTNSFVASIDQPLLGLLHTGYDFAAQRANAKATDAGVQVSRAAIVQAVRTAYLQLFEAQAMEQIAAASVNELEEQTKVARARLKAGVITNADLLRVQVAEANARQQQIAARTAGMVTKANLLDALGMRPSDPVEFTEPTTLLQLSEQPLPDLAGATSHAEAKRPEIAQADFGRRSADHTRTARYLSLLPEVDAEGAYVRTDGQLFAPGNQWFVGVRANWAIWEWGATFFQARAAGHQAAAAALDLENEKRVVAVEVQNALAQAQAAAVSVDVARAAISSAQEAYRVEQALLQAGSATTTDLLDAQSALTTARLNLARAQYELAIQRVALSRVTAE
jgi:outer membrane protein